MKIAGLAKLFKFRENAINKAKSKGQGNETNGGDSMSFLDHLEDLRLCLIKIVISLIICLIASLAFRTQLFEILRIPLKLAEIPPENLATVSLKPVDPIVLTFKLAFYASLVFSAPLNLYFLAQFILPALKKSEKKTLFLTLLIGSFLFIAGALFCFFIVLPRTLNFFFYDSIKLGIEPKWTAPHYYSFTALMTLIFGFGFELPVAVLALLKLELIDSDTMRRTRSIAIIIIFVFSAVITPTTDILTLLLLALPLIILYEICIWLSIFIKNKDEI